MEAHTNGKFPVARGVGTACEAIIGVEETTSGDCRRSASRNCVDCVSRRKKDGIFCCADDGVCAFVALRGGARVCGWFFCSLNAGTLRVATGALIRRCCVFSSARTQRPVNDERALVAHFTGKGGRRPAAWPVPLTLVVLPVVGTHTHVVFSASISDAGGTFEHVQRGTKVCDA